MASALWGDGRHRTVVLCVALYAALASRTQPLTDLAAAAVAVPGGVVLILAVRPLAVRRRTDRRGRPGPPHRADQKAPVQVARATAAWVTVAALTAAWDLAAWLQQPAYNVASYDHPTLSILLDPVTESGPSRFVAWFCWLYVGLRVSRR